MRRFLIALAAAFLTASSVSAESADMPSAEVIHIRREALLARISALITKGELEAAERIAKALPDDGPPGLDKQFILARIARARGDARAAEDIYRAMLANNPKLHRVRLELARALFERGNLDAADYHFRLVLAADIPDQTRKLINAHIHRMRRDRWWTANAQFSIAPDSNINTGPSTREVAILDLPFQLDKDAVAKSGVGVESLLDGDVRPRVSDNMRMALGARLFAREYIGAGFDDYNLTLRAGPILTHGRGEIAAQALAGRRWYDGDGYSWSYGARIFGDYDLTSRWHATGGATLIGIDVENGARLDGEFYALDASMSHTFNDRSVGTGFLQLSRYDVGDAGESYYAVRIGASYSQELPFDLIGQISPEILLRDYDAPNGVFQIGRSDTLVRVEARATFKEFRVHDFAPFASVSYERNSSNIELYRYDRLRSLFGVTRRF